MLRRVGSSCWEPGPFHPAKQPAAGHGLESAADPPLQVFREVPGRTTPAPPAPAAPMAARFFPLMELANERWPPG